MKNKTPQGVSQWRAEGKKNGYWDYFAKQERQKERERVVEEIKKGIIKFEWITHDEYYHQNYGHDLRTDKYSDFLVCSKCGHHKDDPECPHSCEIKNKHYQDIVNNLNKPSKDK